MQSITIYSPTLSALGRIYSWISLVWTDSYNEGGSCQLELPVEAASPALLEPDHFLVYSETGTVMVILSVQLEAGILQVHGRDAAHILASRAVTGTITAGNAETKIRDMFSRYKGTWPVINRAAALGLTATFSSDQKPDDMECILQAIAREADIGYRMVLHADTGRLTLTLYAPEENADAIFAAAYGNATEITWARSLKNYKNVCVVLLESDGSYTVKATVGDTTKTGQERKELLLLGDADSPDSYAEQGRQALAEQAEILNVDCSIAGGAALGDIITVRLPELGTSVRKRITQIETTAQNGGIERKYTVGDII